MVVQRIESRKEVKANMQRVALQRGPLLYCVEAADNAGNTSTVVLPRNSVINTISGNVLSEKIIVLETMGNALNISTDGQTVQTLPVKITSIPYYTWSNRGKGQMQVWLPEKIVSVKVN
jgi:DUF1680 family protein